MNKYFLAVMALLMSNLSVAGESQSLNIIRASAPIIKSTHSSDEGQAGAWSQLPPEYTDWLAVGEISCASYTPTADTVLFNEPFSQSGVDCGQEEQRSVLIQEKNSVTSEIREISLTTESRTVSAEDVKTETGTKVVSYSKVPKTVKASATGSNTHTFWGALKASDIYGKTSFANGNTLSSLYLQRDTSPAGYYFKLTLTGVSSTLSSDSAALTYLESTIGTMTVSGVSLATSTAKVVTRTGGSLAVYWVLSAAQFNTLSQVPDAFNVTYTKN